MNVVVSSGNRERSHNLHFDFSAKYCCNSWTTLLFFISSISLSSFPWTSLFRIPHSSITFFSVVSIMWQPQVYRLLWLGSGGRWGKYRSNHFCDSFPRKKWSNPICCWLVIAAWNLWWYFSRVTLPESRYSVRIVAIASVRLSSVLISFSFFRSSVMYESLHLLRLSISQR